MFGVVLVAVILVIITQHMLEFDYDTILTSLEEEIGEIAQAQRRREDTETIRTLLENGEFDFHGISITEDHVVIVVGDDGVIFISNEPVSNVLKGWAYRSDRPRTFRSAAASVEGGDVIVAGDRGRIRLSGNHGETWSNPGVVTEKDIDDVALSEDGTVAIAVGEDGLIRISEDRGANWSKPDSVTTEDVTGIALSADGKKAIAVGDNGLILVSENAGQEWLDKGSGERRDDFRAVASSDDGRIAIAVGDNGLIKRSEDGGENWKAIDNNIPDDLHAVAVSGDGTIAIAAGYDGAILVSPDMGKTWQERDSRTPSTLKAIAFSADERNAYVVGERSAVLRIGPLGQDDFLRILALRISMESASGESSENPDDSSSNPAEAVRQGGQDLLYIGISVRIGILAIALFLMQHLSTRIRYHLRLAAFYDARADAMDWIEAAGLDRLAASSQDERIAAFERVTRVVSPDDVDFGSSARMTTEQAARFAESVWRGKEKGSSGP